MRPNYTARIIGTISAIGLIVVAALPFINNMNNQNLPAEPESTFIEESAPSQTTVQTISPDPENSSETVFDYPDYSEYYSEADYQADLAENKARYEAEKARIEAETAGNLEELEKRRAELEAEYAAERAEWERQNAIYEANKKAAEQAAKAKCDNYIATYGDKSAETLAREDVEVQRKYSAWQEMLRQADEWDASGIQMTQNHCSAYIGTGRVCPKNYRTKANQLETEYYSSLNSKTQYYATLRKSACGN